MHVSDTIAESQRKKENRVGISAKESVAKQDRRAAIKVEGRLVVF